MQQQEVKQQLETVSAQQSSILMKNLIRTTISSITYLRNIFPEDCFVDKKLSGYVASPQSTYLFDAIISLVLIHIPTVASSQHGYQVPDS